MPAVASGAGVLAPQWPQLLGSQHMFFCLYLPHPLLLGDPGPAGFSPRTCGLVSFLEVWAKMPCCSFPRVQDSGPPVSLETLSSLLAFCAAFLSAGYLLSHVHHGSSELIPSTLPGGRDAHVFILERSLGKPQLITAVILGPVPQGASMLSSC